MGRVIIWMAMHECTIALAIPRRDGAGYLRCPAGHHMTETIRAIESIDGVLDVSGLDGYLSIDHIPNASVAAIVNEIAGIFQCEHRHSHSEFWSVVS